MLARSLGETSGAASSRLVLVHLSRRDGTAVAEADLRTVGRGVPGEQGQRHLQAHVVAIRGSASARALTVPIPIASR